MHHGTNTKGRPIHKGPKGGLYVLQNGKKIYKFKVATGATGGTAPPRPSPPPTTTNVNTKGRPIHKGPKGGLYVLQNGKKIYKFKVAVAPAPAPSPKKKGLTTPLKARLLKLAEAIKKRKASPKTNSIKFKSKEFTFTKFSVVGNPSLIGGNKTLQFKTSRVKYVKSGINEEGMAIREDELPLQTWISAQGTYINKLDNYDFYTAIAYTVRSHQWIGPWLRGSKSSVYFSRPPGFIVPLFPQVSALMDKDAYKTSIWARTFILTPLNQKYTWYSANVNNMPMHLQNAAIELYVKDLQRIIKNAPPLPQSMIVYRGIDSDIFKGKLGAMHTLNEFASTAYVPQYLYGKSRYMRLKLLKGSRILLLQGLNNWDANGEFEILLNKGARYIIRKRNILRPVLNRPVIPRVLPKKYITDITVL